MRTCQYYDGEPCINLVEGRTNFCSTHNRLLRKAASDSAKGNNKRLQAIEKAKERKPRQQVNKVSDKQRKLNEQYTRISDKFKKENPICGIRVNQFCSGKTESVHHKRGRGKYLLDVSTFIGCCISCHTYIENHPEEAKQKGWSESRLAVDQTKPTI